ncbi:MAG TPA: hypothetical protein VK213_11300 [Bacteroidales bacterium]|nr:hypothetical protein [Bacteroidales bacterium]
MKKIFAVLFLLSFIFMSGYSQKVDSIKVEQSGDFIKIRYKILNSEPGQMYRVKILCSINGGLNTELRSISGDAGDLVPGGKPEYWVIWDVLKDVESIQSVDFIVRAELVSGKQRSARIFNIQGSVQVPGPTFGARIGVMGRYGISAQFARGMGVLKPEILYREQPVFNRFSLDFTSRLVNKRNFQMHLLTGFTLGNTVIKEVYSSTTQASTTSFKFATTPGPELGLSFWSKRIVFTISGTKLLTGMTEDGESISKNTYLVLSTGVRF